MDVEALLKPVSEDKPCGPSLEYDPQYLELNQLIEQPADPEKGPEWGKILGKATGLLDQSKDLRLALQVARAGLNTAGFPGYRDGLAVFVGLMEAFWPLVHPELDEDDGDATERVMLVQSLCHPTELFALKRCPVVSTGAGTFSLRDIHMAQGKMAVPEGEEAADPALVEAAFREIPVEELQETALALAESIDCVERIDKALTEALGSGAAPDVQPLTKAIQEVRAVVVEKLAMRAGAPEGAAAPAAAAGGGPAAAAMPAAQAGGPVNSRQDVMRSLDEIIRYFERAEPSSPVPLLLRRAQRLVDKSFLDILRDLAPDGVQQAELFRGSEE